MPLSNTPRSETKALPFDLALKILDIADANGWHYAPIGDGCCNRTDLESALKAVPNSPFSLVINYKEDYADSIQVSLFEGCMLLEIEDNFYYDYRSLNSLDELKETACSMLKALNS